MNVHILLNIFHLLLYVGQSSSDQLHPVTMDAPIGKSILLPCEAPDNQTTVTERVWYTNDDLLEPIPGYRHLLENGSLLLTVRAEDTQIGYFCQAILVDKDPSEYWYMYTIVVHVHPFIMSPVKNITVDWGTLYRFPCEFGGTRKRTDVRILNGVNVTDVPHNITEDSTIECMSTNDVGTAHSVAYIVVRPGSKEWILKYGASNESFCQPHALWLPNSSVCLPFLNDISSDAATITGPYLVARPRLYSSALTEAALIKLFSAWDDLLLTHSISSTHTDNGTRQIISFTSWRCVDWAKRLTCATVYPRCQPLHHSQESYREIHVCRSHCLAVTELFCSAPLSTSINQSALQIAFNMGAVNGPSPVNTAWETIINVPEAIPDPDSSESPSLSVDLPKICDPPKSFSPHLLNFVKCSPLPLETAYRPRTKIDDVILQASPSDHSTDSCLKGDGRGYRGSATMSSCLPWIQLENLIEQQKQQQRHNHPWLNRLLPLVRYAFPSSLSDEVISTSVCRNPASLAPGPFCLGARQNETFVRENGWKLQLCTDIPPCLSVDKDQSAFVNELSLSSVQIQVIVMTVILVCFVCVFLIVYLMWRTNQCCFRTSSTGSGLDWSAFEFTDIGLDGTASGDTCVDDDTDLRKTKKLPHFHRQVNSGGSDEIYIQHCQRWIRRHRRLQQFNSVRRCFMACWYAFTDWIACQERPTESETYQYFSTVYGTNKDQRDMDSMIVAQSTSEVKCCSLFQSNRSSTHHPASRQLLLKHCARMKRISIPLPNDTRDYEEIVEFLDNALNLRLPQSNTKPIVSNKRSLLCTSTNSGSKETRCVHCGSAGKHLIQNLCPFCRSEHQQRQMLINDAEKDGGDYLSNYLVQNSLDSALTEQSIPLFAAGASGLSDFRPPLPEEYLIPSLSSLIHVKLKQMCYPRNQLKECQRLAPRASGWVILVEAPNLSNLLERSRQLNSSTLADKLGSSMSETMEYVDEQCDNSSPQKDNCPIAKANQGFAVVKMVSDNASLESEANFLREADVLVEFSHKNIIRLLGICLPLKPLSLLFEYMPFGDLTTFLKHYANSDGKSRMFPLHVTDRHQLLGGPGLNEMSNPGFCTTIANSGRQTWLPPNQLSHNDLIRMALDASEALIYLGNKYYVHRDVATRSFLVGNRMVIKLADFCMCRPIKPGVDFKAGQDVPLPFRWLPLESILYGLFQVDTDVWSLGVFLWELYTYAAEPYADLGNEQVIAYLESGGRLTCPAKCPQNIYSLMLSCWSAERSQRPTFTHIRSVLAEVLSSKGDEQSIC